MLTAQAVAWFQAHDLPRPGGIGIFCAGAGGIGEGDARLITAALRVPPPGGGSMAYFEGADMRDPLVAPVFTPSVLAQFPPTLVLTGTRDMAMSSALYTHSQLVAEGVDADLHVFEGLGHYFFADTTLPEVEAGLLGHGEILRRASRAVIRPRSASFRMSRAALRTRTRSEGPDGPEALDRCGMRADSRAPLT